nr:MBL fold metallo-hydrolase [uncultured Ralstonia sp.]
MEKLQREFFYAPRPHALGYEDGAHWYLGDTHVRAFHMPGHTAGHSVLLADERVLVDEQGVYRAR